MPAGLVGRCKWHCNPTDLPRYERESARPWSEPAPGASCRHAAAGLRRLPSRCGGCRCLLASPDNIHDGVLGQADIAGDQAVGQPLGVELAHLTGAGGL